MARVKYTTPNGRLSFEFDVKGVKGAFEQIGEIQGVFEHEKCGLCSSTIIRCNVRTPKNAQGKPVKYFELICQSCDARLDVHQNAPPAETLYITGTDRDGKELPNGGWYIYEGPKGGGRQDAPTGAQYGGQPRNDGYGQAPGGGGQTSSQSDDEKKFRALLDQKGMPYATAINKINKNDGLRLANNCPFTAIPREVLRNFVPWLKGQPDVGSVPTPEGEASGDDEQIPF